MNNQQLQDAQAKLNEFDTQAADLRRAVDEGIQTARALNANVRTLQTKLRAIEGQAGELRQAIKNELNDRAKAAIEAERKAAEEVAKAKQAAKES